MQHKPLQFIQKLEAFQPAPWELIPDLGLYMDQVITYVERQCSALYKDGERVLTPSMVNNYVKIGLISRPVAKKYGREQLAQLLMVCTLKQASSAQGMKQLMTPYDTDTLQQLYTEFCFQQQRAFAELSALTPLPSPLHCAVRSAYYSFLCDAMLSPSFVENKEDKPKI